MSINLTYNIINRAFTDNINNAVFFGDGCHNNTVQNSRFQNQNAAGLRTDSDAIIAMGWNLYSLEVKNLKIINNEFKNHNHHIQLCRHNNPDGKLQDVNFEGAIIDSNDFYNDGGVRTDCNGNSDPNGGCNRTEMLVVLKGGSDNPNNPVAVTNNHFWGTRYCDKKNPDGSTSYRSASGESFEAYIGTKNLIVTDNVFFDSEQALKFADRYDFPWGTENVQVKRNLLYDVGSFRNNEKAVPFWMNQGDKMHASENVFINTRMDYAVFRSNGSDVYFGNNDIVNPDRGIGGIGNEPQGTDTNRIYSSAEEAGYTEDYTFTTDKFTNNPRQITLENVLKAEL